MKNIGYKSNKSGFVFGIISFFFVLLTVVEYLVEMNLGKRNWILFIIYIVLAIFFAIKCGQLAMRPNILVKIDEKGIHCFYKGKYEFIATNDIIDIWYQANKLEITKKATGTLTIITSLMNYNIKEIDNIENVHKELAIWLYNHKGNESNAFK